MPKKQYKVAENQLLHKDTALGKLVRFFIMIQLRFEFEKFFKKLKD